MVSNGNGKSTNEIQEEVGSTMPPNGYGTKDQIPLYIQTSQMGLLDENKHHNKFLNTLKAIPSKSRFKKFGPSPSAKFRQLAAERDEISRSVHSADESSSRHFHVPFVRKVNWTYLWGLCKEWIKEPMNMALLVWIACVAISGAILFLVMTGMLNGVLTRKSERDTWFEVNNQILNALFTLMCLYQHPKRFHHLVLLCRWEPKDILRLRKIYCKNGTYKPHEWMHMMVVVILLHLNCFAQYALCGLNLGYPRSKRPAIGVGLCIAVAIVAPALASVYNILSPLGREYKIEMDSEAQVEIISTDDSRPAALRIKSLEKKYSFIAREDHGAPESRPEWIGGLFDFWNDISLAYLSVFCSFCVFGWNMERLGFGNMYVHIVTFLLFCTAPFFIFNLAAVNINNDAIREALGIAGILLCLFGLLYGGFWRIQMRKKFHLPGNTFCCGHPSATDCFQWLCCCSCSLAQEVRTADYYDVVEDKLCMKQTSDDNQLALSPLPNEDGLPLFKSTPSSPYRGNSSPSLFKMEYSSSPGRFSGGHTPDRHLPAVKEGSSLEKEDDEMRPPVQDVIEKEDTRAP
ncbi:uncharacterized protein LOC103714386 [Phoenix dactylifera]|uniref:Uncharacterized protein LOC103714386 n=1 Tax=Phoenix dactylifera TaxID=42345 RepID=A0A8B7CIS9_PHODC|nr:uncharacterized protein LOC103714386 [Phoenix dactylifera]